MGEGDVMTPEQFVYWLSGYLSGMEHGSSPKLLREVLEDTIKVVKNPSSFSQGIIFNGGCQPL